MINNDNFFQNALDEALNYQTIKQTQKANPERISKLKPHINMYNWEGIEFPVGPKGWIEFELNNKTIALNLFPTIRKQ